MNSIVSGAVGSVRGIFITQLNYFLIYVFAVYLRSIDDSVFGDCRSYLVKIRYFKFYGAQENVMRIIQSFGEEKSLGL